MPLTGFFQNAYVTHDLERAKQLLSDRFGIADYIGFEPDMVLKTPTGDVAAKVKVALGWAGNMQVELIEPVSGFVDHYRAYLPEDTNDASLRFHHVALRRDDLDAMRAEIDALGYPVLYEGEVPGLVFIYLDARETLGHYLEYIWATPEGWSMQGFPQGWSA